MKPLAHIMDLDLLLNAKDYDHRANIAVLANALAFSDGNLLWITRSTKRGAAEKALEEWNIPYKEIFVAPKVPDLLECQYLVNTYNEFILDKYQVVTAIVTSGITAEVLRSLGLTVLYRSSLS